MAKNGRSVASGPEPNYAAVRLAAHVRRRELGLTIRQLAALSGVPKSTLDGVLYGYDSEGTTRTWFAIAAALGMPVGDLLNHLHDK